MSHKNCIGSRLPVVTFIIIVSSDYILTINSEFRKSFTKYFDHVGMNLIHLGNTAFHGILVLVSHMISTIRHFSVTPYITICPSTETYFGLYLRGAMSAVTGTYLFRLLQNIIFFVLRSFFYLNKQCIP